LDGYVHGVKLALKPAKWFIFIGKFIPSFSQISECFPAFSVFWGERAMSTFISAAKASFFMVIGCENTESVLHVKVAAGLALGIALRFGGFVV